MKSEATENVSRVLLSRSRSFVGAGEQRGASFLTRLHQQTVRLRTTFDGPRFHSIGTVTHLMRCHVAEMNFDEQQHGGVCGTMP